MSKPNSQSNQLCAVQKCFENAFPIKTQSEMANLMQNRLSAVSTTEAYYNVYNKNGETIA